MTRQLNLPPLRQIWDHHDPATSRLTGGLLLPEPDYVFCSLGTNDFEKDITADYIAWLADVAAQLPARLAVLHRPAAGRAQERNRSGRQSANERRRCSGSPDRSGAAGAGFPSRQEEPRSSRSTAFTRRYMVTRCWRP